MNIEWAPLKLTTERRLQTSAVIFQTALMMCGEVLAMLVVAIALFKGHYAVQLITLAYLLFFYLDYDTPDLGGRGVGSIWFRSLAIWQHFRAYFPVELVRTVELPPNRNYFFALFPHGVVSVGGFANFNIENDQWNTLFPGLRAKLMTLGYHFRVPLIREMFLAWGMSIASARNIRHLLEASNDPAAAANRRDGRTGNAAAVVVGGAQEAANARPGNYEVVLNRRKGFVRLALQTGTPLVPVISFNEVEVYDQLTYPEGSATRRFQEAFKRVTGVMPVLFFGRGIFQYTFGLLPLRRRITTVVGGPLEVPLVEQPDSQQIERVHAQFSASLVDLFEAHKAKYIEKHETTFMVIT